MNDNMGNTFKSAILTTFIIILIFPIPYDSLSQSKTSSYDRSKSKLDTIFFDISDEPFPVTEELPVFPGGDEALKEYIMNNANYPQTAIVDSVTGTVFVSFVINTDGSIGDCEIRRGIRSDLDEECIRIIKGMPNWKPGKQIQGSKKGAYWSVVKVRFSIPIIFTIDTLSTQKGMFIIRPKGSISLDNNSRKNN